LGMSPTYLGNGLIHLGGTASNTVDLSNAITLSLTGLPGANDPNAIVIPVFPGDTVSASEVAGLILSAIDTAQVNRGLAVDAVADGSRRVDLVGPTVISDFSLAPSLPINRSGDSISTYQNIVNVIGHTIANGGPLGVENALAGDDFGAFEASGPPSVNDYPGALRGIDNAHEGVYIDDLIIGFAERGEMVVGSQPNATFVQNDELLGTDLNALFVPDQGVHVGPYELKVRRATEFGRTLQDATPEILLQRSFDTNDRLNDATSFTVPAGNRIIEGQVFTLSDGLHNLTFEFDDQAIRNGVASGNVPVRFRTSDSAVQVARIVRQAINSPAAQAVLDVVAAASDGIDDLAPGSQTLSTSNKINLFGNSLLTIEEGSSVRTATSVEPNDTTFDALDTGIGSGITTFTGTGTIGDTANDANDVDMFVVDLAAGQTINVDIDANQIGSPLDPIITEFDSQGQILDSNDDFDGLDSFLQFTAATSGLHYIGVSSFANFAGTSFGGFFFGGYSPFIEGSGTNGFSTGDYTLHVTSAGSTFALTESKDFGDSNVARDQGQILIHSNHISNSLDFGVLSQAGARDSSGSPRQGPARTTREVNVAGVVPGVVVSNNVIASSGNSAIGLIGEASNTAAQAASIPFARVVNNTLVGRLGSGTGIRIENTVSPTILNNIVADFSEGISIDAADAVIGGTVYRGNTTDVASTNVPVPFDEGASPIMLSDTDPLFIDETLGNFYLAPESRAIDSSINDLQDRPDLVAIKSPLGIGLSPILAPDLDALGQTRVDDPAVDSPPGQGGNVFKDRGALDRADFAGPTAVLINPRDNDALGLDSDQRDTFVNLTNQVVNNFSIQLIDGVEPNDPQDGTGAEDASVRSDRVTVFRDDVKLEEGVDYKFSYDTTNNIIRITPLAGIWEVDRKYDIELSNSRGLLITAPNGTEVVDGDNFDLTDDFGNTVNFEFDSGYVL